MGTEEQERRLGVLAVHSNATTKSRFTQYSEASAQETNIKLGGGAPEIQPYPLLSGMQDPYFLTLPICQVLSRCGSCLIPQSAGSVISRCS